MIEITRFQFNHLQDIYDDALDKLLNAASDASSFNELQKKNELLDLVNQVSDFWHIILPKYLKVK